MCLLTQKFNRYEKVCQIVVYARPFKILYEIFSKASERERETQKLKHTQFFPSLVPFNRILELSIEHI